MKQISKKKKVNLYKDHIIVFQLRVHNLLLTGVVNTFMDNNVLANINVNGNNTAVNIIDEATDSSSNGDASNEEKTFYSKVDVYKSELKYPEKVMISFDFYQKIIHGLKQSKSGKTSGIDAKFHGWCKKHFKINIISELETLRSAKTGHQIVVLESLLF